MDNQRIYNHRFADKKELEDKNKYGKFSVSAFPGNIFMKIL